MEAERPIRVQLSRRKGWRMPSNTVRVARPSKWGNPFRIGDCAQRFGGEKAVEIIQVTDAAVATKLFREWLDHHVEQHPEIMRPALEELRGKNLACWCALDAPCHADVLLEIANG